MASEKPKNIRGKILIGILILVVIGLGVLLWLNRDKFGSSAATLTPSPGSGTIYVPSKDILSDNWVPMPQVPKDMYYTLVDETTPNTTDYLSAMGTGSDDLVFAMKPTGNINSGSNTKITVNVYSTGGSVLGLNISINGQWKQMQTTLPSGSWSNKQFSFLGNWTTSDLNTLKVKATVYGYAGGLSISSIYAQVGSSAVSPSPQPSLTFKPETTATRAGLADAVARAYSKSYDKPTPSFKDVPKTHWAYKQIEGLNQAGIMKGYGDGTFKPGNNSTRADATVVLSRAAGIAAYDNPTPSFKDVPKTYWAYKEIEGMKKAGFISGYSDGTYKPDGAGTRATLATLLYRAKKLTATCTGKMFSDIPSSYWACKEVEGVYSRGWMPSAIHF